MSEHWTDRLSEYLDGDLSEAEARGLEAHVASCATCAATLRELRGIVETAGTLAERDADVPANRSLWPGIERRLVPRTAAGVAAAPAIPLEGRRRHGRRIALTVPQLAAAGLALVLFSASGVWLALGGGAESASVAAPASAPSGAESVTFTASWEAAVEELEGEFARRRADLEPGTIQVVERNLAIIDQAIAEARRALEADPSSAFLNGYVVEAMRRKVDLLRQATRINRTET